MPICVKRAEPISHQTIKLWTACFIQSHSARDRCYWFSKQEWRCEWPCHNIHISWSIYTTTRYQEYWISLCCISVPCFQKHTCGTNAWAWFCFPTERQMCCAIGLVNEFKRNWCIFLQYNEYRSSPPLLNYTLSFVSESVPSIKHQCQGNGHQRGPSGRYYGAINHLRTTPQLITDIYYMQYRIAYNTPLIFWWLIGATQLWKCLISHPEPGLQYHRDFRNPISMA